MQLNRTPAFRVRVATISFEHLRSIDGVTLGIGAELPRLSWTVETDSPGWRQAGYEIEAYAAGATSPRQLRGQTGRVEADQSVLVAWPFAPLAARERLSLRVRVWGSDGQLSPWSEPAMVEAGLLNAGDWRAHFISPGWAEDPVSPARLPLLRRAFHLRAGIRKARLYATALGVYEARINGSRVGDQVLSPGWTSYHHRLCYQTYDVTGLVHAGENVLGALLGDGWYRGRLGYGGGRRNIYGDRLALLAQLEVEYADGSVERIASDEAWRAAPGPVLASDIYDGETYDARLEQPGWDSPEYTDQDWTPVQTLERDLSTLAAPLGPPVRRIEQIAPVSITQFPGGRAILDFGQNLVGRLRLSAQGPAGQVIRLRHAEVLENGALSTRPLRLAKATDTYILRGGGEVETWEPRFTFHGFRYAEVEGWPGELQAGDLAAVVCHSDMQRTGWFTCSDPLINQLHENVVWSMRGNFLSIPTDCPQRDERLGWTGDIQVFAPTAAFLYDCAGFLAGWLEDLASEQAAAGSVPYYVPSTDPYPNPPAAAWGDAAVMVPWVLYQRFGDAGILAKQFTSMRAWVDLIDGIAGKRHLWDSGVQFGDWLDPAAPPEHPGKATTPAAVVATAYFARSAELVGQAAEVLGKTADTARYRALAAQVREAFAAEYVTPHGRVIGDSATAYALALQFDLLPGAAQRQRAGERLAALVRASRYTISTGFVGTPLICDALCSAGESAAAYRLLTQTECPSWLYPVSMGATTIWERWDSLLPDGSVNPGEMTSFNHYALGAIADWLQRSVAGLAPAEPGYRRLEVAPIPGGGLTSAAARHITPYGLAECSWKIEGDTFSLAISVPPNTSARVWLPGRAGEPIEVGSGSHRWDIAYAQIRTEKPALTLDSPLGAVWDDPEMAPRVSGLLNQYNPELAARLEGQESMTLRQAAAMMPRAEEVMGKMEELLGRPSTNCATRENE